MRTFSEYLKDIKIFCPVSIYEKLRAKSRDTGIPISHLVIFAIDNELDAPNPFYYPANQPTTSFIQDAYADEAQRIAVFLRKNPGGMSREMLLAHRRTVGIPNKETFLYALRELYEAGVIEEYKPKDMTNFKYPDDARYLRLAKVTGKQQIELRERELKEQMEELRREKMKLLKEEDETT
jgi:hypothetical protein